MANCQQPAPKSQLENRQAANRTTAVIVPALLIGIVGYATWVVIVLLCAHYLINGSEAHGINARPGAGVAIIVLYFVFLLPMAFCYMRLLSTVPHPGFIEKGSPTAATPVKPPREAPQHNVQASCTSTKVQEGTNESGNNKPQRSTTPQDPPVTLLDTKAILSGELPPPPGTERFYSKDVFACDANGLPIWCGTCNNWKPDRAHHGSDVGRCVLKMDHFCPWVGGVVGERNFNFFIQFVSYATLYSLFILIVMAIFVAEVKHNRDISVPVTWIVALALGAVFTLFTGGMAFTSLALVLKNLTTIDNIGHQKRVMFLAVLMPSKPASRIARMDDDDPWQGTITYPLQLRPDASSETTLHPHSSPPPRTFAILRTHPGMNPWNLGALRNFKSVMGEHWYDWFLPLRHSPCAKHNRGDSMYELGADVETLREEVGISSSRRGSSRRKHRKSRHRRDESDDMDIMGSTLANVNGVTGRERDSMESL